VIPGVLAFAIFLLTPFRVGAAVYLNVRLAPIVLLLTLPMLRSAPPVWLLRALAGVSLAGGLVFYAHARSIYLRDGAPLGEVIHAVDADQRVLTLNFAPGSQETYIDPYVYSASIAVAERGGLAAFSFASLPHWSVHYRKDIAMPAHKPFWVFTPCAFRNAIDGEFFDTIIVRGALDPFATKPAGPVYERIASSTPYTVYRKVPGMRWEQAPGVAAIDTGPCPVEKKRGATVRGLYGGAPLGNQGARALTP
jgi:hypothetical protein